MHNFTHRPLEKSSDLLSLLVKGTNLPDPFADMSYTETGHAVFQGDVDTFRWILHRSNSTHKSQSAKSCVRFILKLCMGSDWHHLPLKIRVILEGREMNDDLNDALRNVEDENGFTLLQHIAWFFACDYSLYPKNYEHHALRDPSNELDTSHVGQIQNLQLSEYMSLLRELMMAGSHLHKLSGESYLYCSRTPLLLTISSYFLSFLFGDREGSGIKKEPGKGLPDECISTPTVPAPVYIWLNLLASTGTDLVQYGRREKQLHLESPVNVELATRCYPRGLSEKPSVFYFRLANFTYGPLPGDWKFYFVQEWCIPNDSLVEFWDMVEHPERAMPGAWND